MEYFIVIAFILFVITRKFQAQWNSEPVEEDGDFAQEDSELSMEQQADKSYDRREQLETNIEHDSSAAISPLLKEYEANKKAYDSPFSSYTPICDNNTMEGSAAKQNLPLVNESDFESKEGFNLREAVIYSELLAPKWKE